MYNTHIQTTISILGHIVFIEYMVTEEWAIEWWLSDEGSEQFDRQLVCSLLRAHYADKIYEILLTEFESRQYNQEQAYAATFADADIPF